MSEELTTPMPEEQPKKKRRKRRSKAEIEAEKAAKAAAAAEAAEMEAKGYVKVRHRDEHGHFMKDDPSTPENEAWEWKKIGNGRFSDPPSFADEEEECIPCKEEAAAALEAAEAALEKEVEINFGSSYEKEVDAIVEEPVVEEIVESASLSDPEPPKVKDPYADYVPMTGLAKLRNRGIQRQRRDASAHR